MIGSHLSVAGGLTNALDEAQRLGLDTVQVFTKNQRQWRVPPLSDSAADAWLSELRRLGWTSRTVAHNSYLVNLASPDPDLRAKSLDSMREDLDRCRRLSIRYLVFHPGAHMGQGVAPAIERLAQACATLLRETRGSDVVLCLENTAGGGTTLGRTLEELAAAKAAIDTAAGPDARRRVGFCIDTCHALAAGYDLASTPAGDGTGRKRTRAEGRALGQAFLQAFDRACGLSNLRVLHLNDSLAARASRLDRHAHIGQGKVAPGVFAAIVNHPALRNTPMILETPKGDDPKGKPWDLANARRLRALLDH
ncbi:MAG: deoxyribonuclease IV [Phycisphaerales bacterium]|nr:deoxyribonuclease IV [Phycisphaerales bacterium]